MIHTLPTPSLTATILPAIGRAPREVAIHGTPEGRRKLRRGTPKKRGAPQIRCACGCDRTANRCPRRRR